MPQLQRSVLPVPHSLTRQLLIDPLLETHTPYAILDGADGWFHGTVTVIDLDDDPHLTPPTDGTPWVTLRGGNLDDHSPNLTVIDLDELYVNDPTSAPENIRAVRALNLIGVPGTEHLVRELEQKYARGFPEQWTATHPSAA